MPFLLIFFFASASSTAPFVAFYQTDLASHYPSCLNTEYFRERFSMSQYLICEMQYAKNTRTACQIQWQYASQDALPALNDFLRWDDEHGRGQNTCTLPKRERERAIIPVAVITRTLTHHALFTHSLGNSVRDQIIKFQRSTFFQRFQPHLTVFYNNWMGVPWLWIPHSLDYTTLHLLIGSARWDCIWCVIFLYKHISLI